MQTAISALHSSIDQFSRAAAAAASRSSAGNAEPALRGVEEANEPAGATNEEKRYERYDEERRADEVKETTEALTTRDQVRAAIALVRAKDETVGSLLNVFA